MAGSARAVVERACGPSSWPETAQPLLAEPRPCQRDFGAVNKAPRCHLLRVAPLRRCRETRLPRGTGDAHSRDGGSGPAGGSARAAGVCSKEQPQQQRGVLVFCPCRALTPASLPGAAQLLAQ